MKIIETPEECGYLGKEYHKCYHVLMHKNGERFQCNLFEFPDECPLTLKADDNLMQDIYDNTELSIIIKSDIYLKGFEDGLDYQK